MFIEPWPLFIELQRSFLFQPITEYPVVVGFFGNRLWQTGREFFELTLECVAADLRQMFQADVVQNRRRRCTAELTQWNVCFGQSFEGFWLVAFRVPEKQAGRFQCSNACFGGVLNSLCLVIQVVPLFLQADEEHAGWRRFAASGQDPLGVTFFDLFLKLIAFGGQLDECLKILGT
ncbi:hypothetical protein CQ025_24430 [Pseudomonas sp. MYb3]|nr:hypothetical protein CQ025_24430 [Pseudomonas sp. MYb3]